MGNESHYVAVPPDRDPNPVREFGCWTAALNQMAELVTVVPDRYGGDASHGRVLDRFV